MLEIGGGFGGHASVLHCFTTPKSYTIVDLESVSKLIAKYTQIAGCPAKVFGCNTGEWKPAAQKADLVVSHYCFSEIDSSAQDQYISYLTKIPRGFMICNIINRKSHHKNKIVKLLKNAHPSLKEYDEVPNTFRGNYVLVWGA